MSIKFANYRGVSWVSDAIKLVTYSFYSHSAALFDDDMELDVDGKIHLIPKGSVIEAWSGGVKLADSLSANHTERTVVDIFKYKTPLPPDREVGMARFLFRSIGKPYDYWNIPRFIPAFRLLIPAPPPKQYDRTHTFCSELMINASDEAGSRLLERCKAFEVPPRDISRSPLLMFERSVVTS